MSGQRHVNAVRAWSDPKAGQQNLRALRKVRSASGAVLALILAAVVVFLLFETPRIAWLAVLAAALILLDVALALGIRQWMQDRMR